MSPRFAGYERLRDAPAAPVDGEALLHTTSRPQAWPSWAQQRRIRRRVNGTRQGLSICTTCWKRRLQGWRGDRAGAAGGRTTAGRCGGAVGFRMQTRRTWRYGCLNAPRRARSILAQWLKG